MEMNVHPDRYIFTLINFLILFLILKHLLFGKVKQVIASRQSEIESNIKEADENKAKAAQYVLETEATLSEAKQKGKTVVEQYKKNAEKISDELVKDANKEAQQIIERANKEAEREKQKAEAEIKTHVVDLAVLLSAKALEKSINEEEHRRLINDFIAKVGK